MSPDPASTLLAIMMVGPLLLAAAIPRAVLGRNFDLYGERR